MGKVYFTRHGQTIWNVENKICGATDIALTELGHEQAMELGRTIKSMIENGEMQVDEILYSPLVRAADTAKHISDVTGIPARVEPRLKEQNFGRYESTPRNGEEFGRMKEHEKSNYAGEFKPVGMRQDLKKGTAYIYANLEGSPKYYEIEIEKIYINSKDNKSFVIHVTDPRLLKITGGIVQGMSGSPILQNGKVVGAVTHVLVDDPTRGYGVFIEEMLER